VSVELTWDLGHVYPSAEAWDRDCRQLDADAAALAAFAGQLGSPSALLRFLRFRDEVAERFQRVAAYARMALAADGTDPGVQARAGQAQATTARLAAAIAFVAGELLARPPGTVEGWLAADA